jgi:hypothetical protein
MYEEKDIELISGSIPVWQRINNETENPFKIQKGHFYCPDQDCGFVKSLPGGRRYKTCRVVNFEHSRDSIFNFLIAPGDSFYVEVSRGSLPARIRDLGDMGWAYWGGEDIKDQQLYVRGYWDKKLKFIHFNGKIRLGDHFDVMRIEDEEGNDYLPEVGIQIHAPAYAGAYFIPDELIRRSTWSRQTVISQSRATNAAAAKIKKGMSEDWFKVEPLQPRTKKKRKSGKYHGFNGGTVVPPYIRDAIRQDQDRRGALEMENAPEVDFTAERLDDDMIRLRRREG